MFFQVFDLFFLFFFICCFLFVVWCFHLFCFFRVREYSLSTVGEYSLRIHWLYWEHATYGCWLCYLRTFHLRLTLRLAFWHINQHFDDWLAFWRLTRVLTYQPAFWRLTHFLTFYFRLNVWFVTFGQDGIGMETSLLLCLVFSLGFSLKPSLYQSWA